MNYQETVDYIHAVSWKGSVPGLERIKKLCDLLGDPQKKLKFIHIAGTNGKGSVSAMTASVLRAAGYNVGLYISPYLVDFCERIQFDGEPISHEDLIRVTAKVKEKADLMEDAPTVFELITAIAFQYYSEKDCDVVVLECGLGGRLDATNIIDDNLLAVITNIALDHTEILGDTVEKIAGEKAGIIKSGPCVTGILPTGAGAVVEAKCREKGVSLRSADEITLSDERHTRNGIYFTYGGVSMRANLSGAYQVNNIKTVLAIMEQLNEIGMPVSPDAVKRGLDTVYWPGRFETLKKKPYIIYDGAHNPDGVGGAVATCKALFPKERIVLVVGVMKDKSYEVMVKSLSGISDVAYAGAPDTPRALPAKELATALTQVGLKANPCDSMKNALERAAKDAEENGGIVLCVGSLYSYGELKAAAASLS
ncbi:MAG: bifunctional folylpolyglutamate synthase/dihydrofolate synthase [Clostridia bacterium]|nr:bifunctional folylpolyglutamate synthase/dihydrofolate synthase [Clostridia bacterium]